MKYAIKTSSKYIDINCTNKIMFFDSEKDIICFFQNQMKKDLINPITKNERLPPWKLIKYKESVHINDILTVYSLMINSDVDFKYLSNFRRVCEFIRTQLSIETYMWAAVKRMCSFPCNYILYEFTECCGGKKLQNIRWAAFFKKTDKQDLFKDLSLVYRITQEG